MTTQAPWTWFDFEREAQTAVEPFNPESVSLSQCSGCPPGDTPVWPDKPPYTRWIACYAVRGASEGWYVHVDLIPVENPECRCLMMLLAKFWSQDEALKAVKALTRLITAHE